MLDYQNYSRHAKSAYPAEGRGKAHSFGPYISIVEFGGVRVDQVERVAKEETAEGREHNKNVFLTQISS